MTNISLPADRAVTEAMVEALRFYADTRNWSAGCWPGDPGVSVEGLICMDRQVEEGGAIAFADCGDRARAALSLAPPVAPTGTVDEVSEDEIRSRAKAIIRRNGWLEQNAPQLHSVIELMVSIGIDVLKNHPASCGYPRCGCDFDAVCNAALSAPTGTVAISQYWRDGTALIEACLAKAVKADPQDAPMPLVGDEAKAWHSAQAEAYRHALEMMGVPECLSAPTGEGETL